MAIPTKVKISVPMKPNPAPPDRADMNPASGFAFLAKTIPNTNIKTAETGIMINPSINFPKNLSPNVA